MNFLLLPSLLHAATVRTASLLYNDIEIDSMLKRNYKCSTCTKSKGWEFVEMKIVEKLPALLPVTVQKGLAKAIFAMHCEISIWRLNHFKLFKHIIPCFSVYLTWKMDGTINRIETAKKIVLDDSIDPDIRFILACTYFLEDEILTLWKKIKETDSWVIWKLFQETDEKRITRKGTNSAVRFWLERLQSENIMPSIEIIVEYFSSASSMITDVPLRVSSFFHFLPWETKKNYIRFIHRDYETHSDDFQTCVRKLNETERTEMFREEYFVKHALVHCLSWPFRSLFLKMAKEAFCGLTVTDFGYIVLSMLIFYADYGEEDFHILEEFWQMSPDAFKDEASMMGGENDDMMDIFREVKKNILETDNACFNLKKFVRENFSD